MKKLTLLRLIAVSILLKIAATLKRLPSNHIDTWMRFWTVRYVSQLGIARGLQIFINPISSIRYFEFDFATRHMEYYTGQRILDVSSPRVFAFYYCKRHPTVNYTMLNPDHKDIEESQFQARALEIKNFSILKANAISLPFKNKQFERVISISVIEHIAGDGDTKAIREMWRVLKPGGKLILTTHIANQKRVEYRCSDQYNLSNVKRKRYFFQRVYDEESFRKRILSHIPAQTFAMKTWGEKERGWFDDYIQRWIKRDLEETVYDPWYMVTQFEKFESVAQLPGIGVIGVVYQKPL